MYRCHHNQAARYLTDHCTPISDIVFRQRLPAFGQQSSRLRSMLPRYRLSTYGRRAFSVAGPTVWNSLPEDMRDPECSVDSYRQSLKTFSQYFVFSAFEVCYENALYKLTFDTDTDIDILYHDMPCWLWSARWWSARSTTDCCSVLICISGRLLSKPQSVLNAAARLIFLARRSDHSTPLLREFHWLRIPERVQIRLCVLIYRCLHGTAKRRISPTICDELPILRVADVFVRLSLIRWLSRRWTGQHLATVRLQWQRRGLGTVCQHQWELQRPCPHSGSNWRPSSVDSISVKLSHSGTSPFKFYWLF